MHYLLVGTLMGLSAGLAPGPLLTLVISETLQHDVGAGMKVAVAPIITDVPIIVFTLYVLSNIAELHGVLGVISILGGCLVASMGYDNLRSRGVRLNLEAVRFSSLMKGVLTNMFSPHPYLFWLGVGAPIMNRAMSQDLLAVILFILGFYVVLVGSKITLAILVGKSKTFLSGRVYVYVMRLIGALLLFLAFALLRDGVQLLIEG